MWDNSRQWGFSLDMSNALAANVQTLIEGPQVIGPSRIN